MKAVNVRKETFAIVKSRRLQSAFACINDGNELTLIIDQTKINRKNIIKIEKDYKLLNFDMDLPFNLVGFIAKISKALANEKIPIFVISSYSTDHILVKKKHLKKTVNKLKSLGFKLK